MRILFAFILSFQFVWAGTRYQDTPMLPTIVAYEGICVQAGITPDIGAKNYTNICRSVTKNELCKDVPEKDLLDCDHLQRSSDKHPWEFIKGCVRGGFDSIQDALKFLWSAAKAIYNYEEAFGYYEVAKLYLHAEFVKNESSYLGLAGSIGEAILARAEALLHEKYTSFGCLNYSARSKLTCSFLADVAVPTEGLLLLLKNPKYFKDAKGIRHLISTVDGSDLKRFSKQLSEYFAARTQKATAWMTEYFGKYGTVIGRSKTEDSILDKLWRKSNAEIANGRRRIASFEEAKGAIGDGVGTRLILNSKGDVQGFVDDLAKKIKEGLNVTEIVNYRPVGGMPYLNEQQIRLLKEAKTNLVIRNGDDAIRSSGYSSLHVNVDPGDGPIWEMQIRGRSVHEVAEIEHFFYDLKAGKGLSNRYVRSEALTKSLADYLVLSESQRMKLFRYISDRYTHARKVEEGLAKASDLPRWPSDLPPSLSFENLKKYLVERGP